MKPIFSKQGLKCRTPFPQNKKRRGKKILNHKYNTSNASEFSLEKESWWDFPPCLEFEDLLEDPEAQIGTGEGETWSQGEAAEAVFITNFESLLCAQININSNR